MLANGAIPVTNLQGRDATSRCSRSAAAAGSTQRCCRARLNGRGLAAADYDNDGRVDLAVGTSAASSCSLHNRSKSGHWLTVDVRPFSPGAEVTVRLDGPGADARGAGRLEYLSSEDPRAHFGFGSATPRLVVRYPDGAARTLRPRADRIVVVRR